MALLGSSVVIGLMVAPLIYILLQCFTFIRTSYYQCKAVLQWPGMPRHWLTGNILQVSQFYLCHNIRAGIILWKIDNSDEWTPSQTQIAFLKYHHPNNGVTHFYHF